jgi:hypothetical protein
MANIIQLHKPKSTVTAFLTAWQNEDWSTMLDICTISWRALQESPEVAMQKLQDSFQYYELESFSIGEEPLEDLSECAYKLSLETTIKPVGIAVERPEPNQCMVICEKGQRQPSLDGTWGVNPVSVWKR